MALAQRWFRGWAMGQRGLLAARKTPCGNRRFKESNSTTKSKLCLSISKFKARNALNILGRRWNRNFCFLLCSCNPRSWGTTTQSHGREWKRQDQDCGQGADPRLDVQEMCPCSSIPFTSTWFHQLRLLVPCPAGFNSSS